MKTEDDMKPKGEKPISLDVHLRAMMSAEVIESFESQLPKEFVSDAEEGLGQVKDSVQIESVIRQLNKNLNSHLNTKKQKKKRKPIADMSWTYWTVIIIFLVITVGFFLIRAKLTH